MYLTMAQTSCIIYVEHSNFDIANNSWIQMPLNYQNMNWH